MYDVNLKILLNRSYNALNMWLTSITIAILIAILHIIGEMFSEHIERYHIELLSFGSGFMAGTLFLEIIPHVVRGEIYLGHYIYIFFFVGFVLIHVLEKIIYQKASGKTEFVMDVIRFQALGLLAYGLLIGVIIAVFVEAYGGITYLILAPFYVRAFTISVFSKHIIEKIGSVTYRILGSLGPIVGVIISLFLITDKETLFLVLSISVGAILYIVVRDMIPLGREGKPIYFVSGALITVLVTLIFGTT